MGRRIKAILVGSSGNLVEWYDFYVYTAFSLYFAKSFFPAGDQTAQLLATAGIFAVGFSDAAAGRLAVRPARGPPRPPHRVDRIRAADVLRLGADRGDADL